VVLNHKGATSMIKVIICIAAYIVSIFVFYFIANIVYRLLDIDAELLLAFSLIWPIALIGMIFMLIFYLCECLSDDVYWKIQNLIEKRKEKNKDRKENK
jgi:cellobiose-specific phosphotransferase system component IIC